MPRRHPWTEPVQGLDTPAQMDRVDRIREQIDQAARLQSAGPPTDAYLRWRDGVDLLLADLLGNAHNLRQSFREAVGPFDPLDAEGLAIEGESGMRLRIDRGTKVLRQALGQRD